jgi:hypothetical protein
MVTATLDRLVSEGASAYSMELSIESIDGPTFTGLPLWRELGNSVTTVEGEIVTDFSDVTERSRWDLLEGFSEDAGTACAEFTEGPEIQGDRVDDGGTYYGCVGPEGTMAGVWFRRPGSGEPGGSFTMAIDAG